VRITVDNAQHVGARAEQQDAFGFSPIDEAARENGGTLSVVADGMGGLAQGRAVSQLACRVIIDTYATRPPAESIPNVLCRAVYAAQAAVVDRARQLNVDGHSGTTVAAAAVNAGGLYWISVGDTRIYLYRDGELTQLSADHSYLRQLAQKVMAGELSETAAGENPDRRSLTSFLGMETLTEIDRSVKPFPLRSADRVLICTDGIHGTLSEDEIAGIVGRHGTGAAQALVDAAIAKQRPSQDNATVTLLDCAALEVSAAHEQDRTRSDTRGSAAGPPPRSRRLLRVGLAIALLAGLSAGGIAFVAHAGGANPLAAKVAQLWGWLLDNPAALHEPSATDSAAERRAPTPVKPTDTSVTSRDSAQSGRRLSPPSSSTPPDSASSDSVKGDLTSGDSAPLGTTSPSGAP